MSILRTGLVALLGSMAAIVPMAAQTPQPAPRAVQVKPASQQSTSQEGRVALVIGNGTYQTSPLKNPPDDARAVSAALQKCGFQVQTLVNATLPQMEAALRQFGQRLRAGSVGLFYYAGHGMQVKGSNYLIPVGANIAAEDEVRFKALDASEVLAKMESAGNGLNLMILDACRNDPFGRSWHRGGTGGLAQMDAPTGTYIAFSTAPGKTASDGNGSNGLYTQKFLEALNQPGLKVEEVFKRVRVGVKLASMDEQVPWDSSSLTGDFYFRPGAAPTPTASVVSVAVAPEPGSVVRPHSQPEVVGTRTNTQGRLETSVDLGGGQRMTLVQIPAGQFQMGSNHIHGWKEKPVHTVTISRAFWIGKYPVTQAQWKAVMVNNPALFKGDEDPISMVSWNDCQEFISRLNARGRETFRLPTEAEWEYACRAGSTEDRYGDLAAISWNVSPTNAFTSHPVGRKQPNAWGLYDMNGNVTQFCQDWEGAYSDVAVTDPQGPATGSRRSARGGSWAHSDTAIRSACRFWLDPDERNFANGFRIVMAAP